MTRSSLCLLAVLVSACSASLPPRGVIERDIGDFSYRRYQALLDAEIRVPGNAAVAHSAVYVRRARGNDVGLTSAVVTVYASARALTAEVREQLKSLSGYSMTTDSMEGQYVWRIANDAGEHWVIWVADRYVVKLRPPNGEEVPEAFADAYLDLYPSDLNEHGLARADATSAGTAKRNQDATPSGEPELPASLREGAAR